MAQISETASTSAPGPANPPERTGPSWLGRALQLQEVTIAAIGIALGIYFVFASSSFATMANTVTLSQYAAPIVLFALAEVFILILGEIDLSVGEVYVLAPFIVRYLDKAGAGVIPGIIVALLVACGVGLVNGLVTVKLRVPSFITTLGTVFALEGIILLSSNGTEVSPVGKGTLPFVLGAGAWSEILWVLGFVAVLHVVLKQSTFGLHVVATGGNEIAASQSGVKVDVVKVWCFILCSFLGGFMGILDSYRIGTLDPSTSGLTFMFYGVAAAVIGGTALTGGRGTIVGALIGGAVLGILEDGFNILGVNAFAYKLVLGLAILGAMVLNVQLERLSLSGRGKRSSASQGSFARLVRGATLRGRPST